MPQERGEISPQKNLVRYPGLTFFSDLANVLLSCDPGMRRSEGAVGICEHTETSPEIGGLNPGFLVAFIVQPVIHFRVVDNQTIVMHLSSEFNDVFISVDVF